MNKATTRERNDRSAFCVVGRGLAPGPVDMLPQAEDWSRMVPDTSSLLMMFVDSLISAQEPGNPAESSTPDHLWLEAA